jgi:hypothetical protein
VSEAISVDLLRRDTVVLLFVHIGKLIVANAPCESRASSARWRLDLGVTPKAFLARIVCIASLIEVVLNATVAISTAVYVEWILDLAVETVFTAGGRGLAVGNADLGAADFFSVAILALLIAAATIRAGCHKVTLPF